MRTIESIGKTVDEAISKGLAELGLARDDVNITVLDEGSRGVFGFLGVKFARVKIDAPTLDALDEPEEAQEVYDIPPRPMRESTPRRSDNDRGRRESDRRGRHDAPPADYDDSDVPVNPHPAAQFLYQIAGHMGLPRPYIDVEETDEGTLKISVDGPHVGPFIGHHGDALDALQLLTMLVVNPQGHDSDSYHRVILDVSGYRERRAATLEKLARRLAEKVIDTGEAVDLEPMNAYERRIIHTALSEYSEIETWSEGDEPYRHIVIDLIETEDSSYDEVADPQEDQ